MNNFIIDSYFLEDYLPVITVSSFEPFVITNIHYPNKQTQKQNSFELSSTESNYSKELTDFIGKTGEGIALEYLHIKHNKVISHVMDYRKGYDFEADGQHFEVKTTISGNNVFEISENELKQATKYAEISNLFFIKLNRERTKIYGYIINDFIQELGSELENILNVQKNSRIEFRPTHIRIAFNDEYLATLESDKLNLSDYIPKNWNWDDIWATMLRKK